MAKMNLELEPITKKKIVLLKKSEENFILEKP